ncbi:hypothetical protein TWF481_000072 [Arthrobotrys musiformis]|uniref:non-specific serine/threonine protein kinase n=1 Tax=Arthrobotrys musiformis TaxID=47236 RepID=A0AAV9WN49_9PEZI
MTSTADTQPPIRISRYLGALLGAGFKLLGFAKTTSGEVPPSAGYRPIEKPIKDKPSSRPSPPSPLPNQSTKRSLLEASSPQQRAADPEPPQSADIAVQLESIELTLNEKDAFIAVLGVTGARKSTFVKLLIGRDDNKIRVNIELSVPVFTVRDFDFGGSLKSLLDAPDFDDLDYSDSRILKRLAVQLFLLYRKNAKLAAIIYIFLVSDCRMSSSALENLKLFEELCGLNGLKSVILVVTHGKNAEDISFPAGVKPVDELARRSWFGGGIVERGNEDGSREPARGAIGMLVDRISTAILGIQGLLVDGENDTNCTNDVRAARTRRSSDGERSLIEQKPNDWGEDTAFEEIRESDTRPAVGGMEKGKKPCLVETALKVHEEAEVGALNVKITFVRAARHEVAQDGHSKQTAEPENRDENGMKRREQALGQHKKRGSVASLDTSKGLMRLQRQHYLCGETGEGSQGRYRAQMQLPPVEMGEKAIEELDGYFRPLRARYLGSDFEVISKLLAKTEWAKFQAAPRIYTLLRHLHLLDDLDRLIGTGISDISLPLSLEQLPSDFSAGWKKRFTNTQSIVCDDLTDISWQIDRGKHISLTKSTNFFKSTSFLGRGGHGEVDKVEYTFLGSCSVYARKRIVRQGMSSNDIPISKTFANEVAIMRRVKHRHCVELVTSYTDRVCFGLLISPLADCNLAQYLEDAVQSRDKRSFIQVFFACLATGLCYLHHTGIHHGDIKPQNILVHENKVLYTDFGCSYDWSHTLHSTVPGIPARTMVYASPEVGRSGCRPSDTDKIKSASDVWSLGCVYLEMVTVWEGHKPEALDGLRRSYYWRDPEGIHEWVLKLRHVAKHRRHLNGASNLDPVLALDWVSEMLRGEWKDRPAAQKLVEMTERYACTECIGELSSQSPFGAGTMYASSQPSSTL